MKILKIFFPYILIIFFTFFAFKPLLNPGFFPIHDNTQVVRVYEMTKALSDGMFPVRWSQDLGYGYGYPLFNYYDPFAYYLGGFIGLITDSLFATKILIIILFVISGLSMYLLAKQVWGVKGGLLSSALYVFAPYHAVEVYVRGDIAEGFAYAFLPLIFFGIWRIFNNKDKWINISITSLFFAAVIISHNLTALMASPFVVAFVIFLGLVYKSKLKQGIYHAISALIIGILISAFYSFPAILEMKYSNVLSQIGGGADFRDHFVCLSQFWFSQWGFGGSTKGCVDGISFMIGKYHILLSLLVLIISTYVLFVKKRLEKIINQKLYIIFFLFLGLILSVFLAIDVSKPIWETIKVMAFFQYPWRFLIMISFFVSLIAGFLIWFLKIYSKNKNVNLIISLVLIFFIIFVNLKFFAPQKILNVSSIDFTSKYSLNWVTSKISDEYMPKNFKKPTSYYEIPDINNLVTKEISIKIIQRKTQRFMLDLNVKRAGKYILPIAYFPAWKAKLDDKNISLSQSDKGMIVDLPLGSHTLQINFKQTNTEVLGNLLSIAGILILFIGIIYSRLKHD